jgi:anthranilate synthase/aminodeoxychorismate synthase-like glutamine amidotransferase
VIKAPEPTAGCVPRGHPFQARPTGVSFAVPLRILMIDNYDSFTWSLVQALEVQGAAVIVVRNDADPVGALAGAAGVVVSPGPGRPEAAGACLEAVRACAVARRPLLGVCLGHQALAAAWGGRVVGSRVPRHGKTVAVRHDGRGLFAGLPEPFEAMLYHSLVVEDASLPAVLEVTARGPEGEVMGLRHRALPLAGVQFHPESIGTAAGGALLANFLADCVAASRADAEGALA